MSHDGFWRVCDDDGLVHHAQTVSYPILLRDNDVDYEDASRTICDRDAGDWLEASPDVPTTCLACYVVWLKLESATITFLEFHKRSLRAG